MKFNFLKINRIFTRKVSIQIYFFIFILLNIFDFLNYLLADIDFFKKLLSWTIIGYIFYKVSPTKIFIGKRLKLYDLLYILGFSLMSITKSLILYTKDQIYNSNKFHIFNYILDPISNSNANIFLMNSFLLGLLIIVLTSIFLLKKYNFSNESFIGSFNFNEYFLFIKIHYLILILFSIFFGLIIFNFFMEWFALAVDSVILVIGLIFYIFKYFHDHSKNKISNYLRIISNTGNNFYNHLILAFSNKKTLFVGISFLLTIHLIVDLGVYMVPYTIGTENTLYFDSLNAGGTEHIPLFNFINFENSQFFLDLENSSDYFLSFIILIIYLVSIFTISSLLILPFFVFYKNLQKRKFKFNNTFAILFLICITFFLMINFLPNISNPISISSPKSVDINGVDIHTNSVMNIVDKTSLDFTLNELLISTILFLNITIFLLFRYKKYKFFFDKIIFIFVLVFFIFYISTFFISTIEKEYNNLFPKLNHGFNEKFEIYQNKNLYKESNAFQFNFENSNFLIYPFSDLNIKNISEISNHKDYLYIQIINNEDFNIKFDNIEKVYFQENVKYSNHKFSYKNPNLIYYLGENYFTIKKIKRGYNISNNLDQSKITNILKIKSDSTIKDSVLLFIEYLRLIFISIFYIFGTLAFVWDYFKTNILRF